MAVQLHEHREQLLREFFGLPKEFPKFLPDRRRLNLTILRRVPDEAQQFRFYATLSMAMNGQVGNSNIAQLQYVQPRIPSVGSRNFARLGQPNRERGRPV